MNKPTITIRFVDFWKNFKEDQGSNIYKTIIDAFDSIASVTVIEEGVPDILIYSCFGNEYLQFDCLKIYFTGENDVPDFNFCDYAISFHYIDFGDRHLRLPLYVGYSSFKNIRKGIIMRQTPSEEKDFCSIVVSNANYADPIRQEFWNKLNAYKMVASGGRYMNNVGDIGASVTDKQKFLGRYKFNIAFENSFVDGYVTEKLVQPKEVGSVPIYWGGVRKQEFNKKAYIDISDFRTIDEAVEYIIKVDSDDDLYREYQEADLLEKNPFLNYEELLSSFFENVIKTRKRYTTKYGKVGIMLDAKKSDVLEKNRTPFQKIKIESKKILINFRNKLK